MDILKAAFVASFAEENKCPKTDIPEYAMIGRSNVGKSSLINYICQRKGLAKVSSTPGKTQTINFFLIDETWHLVDLPGYGYARRSKSERDKWAVMIENYLLKREQLQYIFVLVDSRIPPQALDLNFINFLGEKQLPFVIVFTKADKPDSEETLGNIARFKEALSESWEDLPDMFVSSAERNNGRELLLAFIGAANKDFAKISRQKSAVQSPPEE